MRQLVLTVAQFTGPRDWEWSLTEAGRELGRHVVRLDSAEWQCSAFADLFAHVGWRTTAASRRRLEPAVGRQVGEWAAERLLGDLAAYLEAPATVEVVLPGPAATLALLPLEAMVVAGRTLALRRVTFAFHVCPDGRHAPPPAKRSPTDRLRILAVFSLPSGTTALALRRERVALTRLLDRVDGDIELRVLQYGTTRKTLRQACADPSGWDIVHVSGHGEAASIILEMPDSTPDPMSASDLVDLMSPLRESVSLITLSSCQSAAVAGDAGLAGDLARSLDCSVLAMRFPVGDRFAAELVLGVYDEAVRGRRELPVALGATLQRLDEQLTGEPRLSFSTPTLFGCRAVSATTFTVRPAPPGERPHADFPVPARFVGRVALLSRAGRALAADSGSPGVVFQGMTGVGKTACARELVDVSTGRFDSVVWHSVPATAPDFTAALVAFAEVLDGHHPGLGLREAIGSGGVDAVASALAKRCRRSPVLTVLDNAESLLDAQGRWYAGDWERLVRALTPDGSRSRLVVTSRRSVEGAYETCVVDPLSRDESLLLVRELPRLGELIQQRSATWSRLIGRVLDLAQGHPAVLELADAQVRDDEPDSLRVVLDGLDRGTGDYPQVLVDWTEQALAPLLAEQRRLFQFLCCLEEPDRQDLLAGVGPLDWSRPWEATGGVAPIGELLPPLLASALVTRGHGTAAVHPAVVAHVRAEHAEFVADVTEAVAGRWGLLFAYSLSDRDDTGLPRRAAWRGLPYAMRLNDAFRLQAFVDHILREDHSRATSIVLRSTLTQAVTWESPPSTALTARYLLAKAGRDIAPDSTEAMRAVIADALAAHDWDTAGAMSAELFERLYRLGDLDEAQAQAQAQAQTMIELSERDGSPPGRLGRVVAERFLVDVLNRRGCHAEALAAGTAVLKTIDDFEKDDGNTYVGAAVHVGLQRRRVLSALSSAADGLGRWEAALDYNRALLAEERRSGASPMDLAITTYNAYIPLMRLGRLEEAAAAIATARAYFERAGAQADLGRALGAQGEIELKRGNQELALELVGEGLRHSYRQPDASTIAIMHGIYGAAAYNVGRLDVAVSHLAAAAALQLRMGDSRATGDLGILDVAIRAGGRFAGDQAAATTIEQTVGAGFRALAEQVGLARDGLADACAMARRRGGALPAHLLAIWDPLLSALGAAARGDAEARVELVEALAVQGTNPDWRLIVGDIRALLDRTSVRSTGGDEVDKALRERAQAAWAGEPVVRPNLWRAIRIRELLADVVLGALGDSAGRSRALAVVDDPRLSQLPLTARFRLVLHGERDPDVLVPGLDPDAADVVNTIIDLIS